MKSDASKFRPYPRRRRSVQIRRVGFEVRSETRSGGPSTATHHPSKAKDKGKAIFSVEEATIPIDGDGVGGYDDDRTLKTRIAPRSETAVVVSSDANDAVPLAPTREVVVVSSRPSCAPTIVQQAKRFPGRSVVGGCGVSGDDDRMLTSERGPVVRKPLSLAARPAEARRTLHGGLPLRRRCPSPSGEGRRLRCGRRPCLLGPSLRSAPTTVLSS